MSDHIIIEPKNTPKATIIWLHGLGADGNDFTGLIPELKLSQQHHIRFIFPHAPMQAVTINMGMVMRSWYDIKHIDDIKRDIDKQGILNSVNRLESIISTQTSQGIDSENIIIAGFSQGGVVAALTALTTQYRLGGVILLSTYLPDWEHFSQLQSDANQHSPFFIGHGLSDPIVPIQAGLMLKQSLQHQGINVQWHDYPMEHSVCLNEILDISQFIHATLGNYA